MGGATKISLPAVSEAVSGLADIDRQSASARDWLGAPVGGASARLSVTRARHLAYHPMALFLRSSEVETKKKKLKMSLNEQERDATFSKYCDH